jgi:hypothetical protein
MVSARVRTKYESNECGEIYESNTCYREHRQRLGQRDYDLGIERLGWFPTPDQRVRSNGGPNVP